MGYRYCRRKDYSEIRENSILFTSTSLNGQTGSHEKGKLIHQNERGKQNGKDWKLDGIFLCFFYCFQQDRLVANEFLQCRKVCEHVLDKILGSESGVNTMISNNSQSNQNDNSSEGSQVPPEDKIELYCNNVVYIKSIQINSNQMKFDFMRHLWLIIFIIICISVA